MAQFVFNVNDIDDSGRDYQFPIEKPWLTTALEGSGYRAGAGDDGELAFHAQKSGGDILVQGTLRTRIVADCIRCLEDAAVDIDVELTALMTEGAAPAEDGEEFDLSPEELSREYYTGDEIELDEFVRENIIVEVPMQPLCSEDCKGIEIPAHVRPPADFGKETIDPRLQPLQKLANKISKK